MAVDIRRWVHRCGGYEQETILLQEAQGESASRFRTQRGLILAGRGQIELREFIKENCGFPLIEAEHYRVSDTVVEIVGFHENAEEFYDTWEFHSSGKRAQEENVRKAFSQFR